MTEVAFHFNAPDKLGYVCRLLRKALTTQARVVVTGPDPVLRALDVQLWTFAPLAFVPHCMADAPPRLLRASPIVLAEAAHQGPHQQVLVNLGESVPGGFERFERLIEVVGLEDADRLGARQRWRHYADRGYAIRRHDLVLQEAG